MKFVGVCVFFWVAFLSLFFFDVPKVLLTSSFGRAVFSHT